MIFRFPKIFSASQKLAELALFPSFCQICSTLLEKEGERVVCQSCLDKIAPVRLPFCICCGRYFEGAGDPHLCLNCLQARPHFSRHRSCGFYRGELKDLILLFKYRQFMVLGKELAKFAEAALGKEEDLWWEVDALVSVPLHRRRQKERGFNQAQIIAKELAKFKKLELVDNSLIKVKNIAPQTSLEARERVQNVRGAFQARKQGKLKNRVVLLVDDVFTTGSTLNECSLVLKEAGVKDVRALTIAQA